MQKVNILENIPGYSRSRFVRRVMQGLGEVVGAGGREEKEVRAGLWAAGGSGSGELGESVSKTGQNNSGNLRTGGEGKAVLKPC